MAAVFFIAARVVSSVAQFTESALFFAPSSLA
jgi:hypothetical protein